MKRIISVLCALLILFSFCACDANQNLTTDNVPSFSDKAYVEINNNQPQFSSDELAAVSYERYSPLDSLGRCGVAMACVGIDIMPTEERGSIGQVKPTGWHTVKYDIVDGKYLYNRCHLIGYQLTGENANEANLITGTRYMNVDGMLPFENMIADYVKETENHVLYRVTPIYDGNNLLARGVQLEAMSVEDNGEGVCFNVYVYNAQPGITIDYATGLSCLEGEELPSEDVEQVFVLNISSKKFHDISCGSVKNISDENRKSYKGSRQTLIEQGYEACKNCNP